METNDQAFMKVNAIVILLVDIVSSSRDFSIAHRARVWEKKKPGCGHFQSQLLFWAFVQPSEQIKHICLVFLANVLASSSVITTKTALTFFRRQLYNHCIVLGNIFTLFFRFLHTLFDELRLFLQYAYQRHPLFYSSYTANPPSLWFYWSHTFVKLTKAHLIIDPEVYISFAWWDLHDMLFLPWYYQVHFTILSTTASGIDIF